MYMFGCHVQYYMEGMNTTKKKSFITLERGTACRVYSAPQQQTVPRVLEVVNHHEQ